MKFEENYINQREVDSIKNTDDLDKIGIYSGNTGRPVIKFSLLAQFFMRCIDFRTYLQNGVLYIYNRSGYYEVLEEWLFGILCKKILDKLGPYWSLATEKQIIEHIRRSAPTTNEFNATNAINLKNGVFDFDEFVLKKHSPKSSLFTYQCEYSYDSTAECPDFKKFLKETTDNDDSLIEVIREIIGYTLSNSTKAEKGFIFVGDGRNGKSVLATTMQHLVGVSNFCSIPIHQFDEKFGIEGLTDKKLNICGENEIIRGTEKLKSIISGEVVNVQRKYKSDLNIRITAKNVFLTNNLPASRDLSYGFFRKILIIPFSVTIPQDKVNPNLSNELLRELPGIFNFALKGLKRLSENNFVFTQSKKTLKALEDYEARSNPVEYFFKNGLEFSLGDKTKKSDVPKLFSQWCKENDFNVVFSSQQFWQLARKKEAQGVINLAFKKVNGIEYLNDYIPIKKYIKKEENKDEFRIEKIN